MLVVLALALVQVEFVVCSAILVQHAAREGARAAAVGGTDGQVEDAVIGSSGLSPRDTDIRRTSDGDRVTVRITHLVRTEVPLVGPLLRDMTLTATVTMRRESG
ncbi:MAG: hypothetical protein MK184_02890 [Acidimicrobiales bacterium]|nr:hypothetical protein [Acidimicrobiales bacterium]